MTEVLIKPYKGPGVNSLRELWAYRELLFFLAWRNIKVRYSQAVIGVLWVVIQPLMAMLIFAVIFGKFAGLPSGGAPYTVFVFSALLPWNLFANSVSGAGASLIANRALITKIYFPRIIVPMAEVVENMVDFMISGLIMLCLMLLYGILPTGKIFAVPFLFLWLVMLTLGVGFWVSAVNARYRDVNYAVPFLMQAWLYLSPVAYSLSLVPQKWHKLYSLNPMVGVIESFRWAFLGNDCGLPGIIPYSLAITIFVFITGFFYFCRVEKDLSDVI